MNFHALNSSVIHYANEEFKVIENAAKLSNFSTNYNQCYKAIFDKEVPLSLSIIDKKIQGDQPTQQETSHLKEEAKARYNINVAKKAKMNAIGEDLSTTKSSINKQKLINKPKIKTAVSHSTAIPATNKTNEKKVTFDKSLKEDSSSKSKHTSGEKFPKSNTITSPRFAKEGLTTKSGLASLEQILSRSRANAIPEDRKKKWVFGKKPLGRSQGF